MNAAFLLMTTAWVAGADPVPPTVPPTPMTVTTAPVAPSGGEGEDCCTGNCEGACGEGDCCEHRQTLRSRLAGLFRRLQFWKRADDCCETDCGCQPGCSGEDGPGVVYPAASDATTGTAAEVQEVRAADKSGAGQVQPVAFQAAARPAGEARAKVVVALPVGARLFIDDRPIQAGPGETAFQTPLLKVGEAYFYRVRAELVRDGQTVREEMQVVVRAGEEALVSFLAAPPRANAARPTSR